MKQTNNIPASQTFLTAPKNITHCIPPKVYRVDQQDVFNYVRNNVYETFKVRTSRSYDIIKQLTNNRTPNKGKEIDRICKKYSILDNKKNKMFEGVSVNVDAITKHYIKSKSKDKQKQEQKNKLKQDIAKTYRYGPKKEYSQSEQFFSFDGNNLKNFEKKHKDSFRKSKAESKKDLRSQKESKQHPYLKIYEGAQAQAMRSLVTKNSLLMADDDYLNLPEMEDWQKNSINLKDMVAERKNQNKKLLKERPKRQVKSARPRITSRKPQFYLS